MLDAIWESYAKDVLPENAGRIQHSECQMAFYAGSAATLSLFDSFTGGSEDVAVAKLQELHEELDAFAETTKAEEPPPLPPACDQN